MGSFSATPCTSFRYAAASAIAGKVSLRQGSMQIPTSCPSWLYMDDTCVFEVAMVTLASGSTSCICRYTRCTMDSRPPSSVWNILINCLDRISLDNGQRRCPDPPDKSIIFINCPLCLFTISSYHRTREVCLYLFDISGSFR